jgi:lysophospholipase L1-like esterase
MRLSVSVLVLILAATTSALAGADQAPGRLYLALGDSDTFGFIADAGFEYVNPDNFVGFPNYLSQALKLNDTNAACPGETTGSFLSSAALDDGCRFFRSQVPLHVSYNSTQLNFSVSFLKSHPQTRLVTISLGANDVFLLEDVLCHGDPQCIATNLPSVLANVEANLQTILADLEATGFRGTIVLMNYYSLDYADASGTGITVALNESIHAAAAERGAVLADVFKAFEAVAAASGGHTCNAGLLNAASANQFTCDVHPSQSGQALIARTIEQALKAAP